MSFFIIRCFWYFINKNKYGMIPLMFPSTFSLNLFTYFCAALYRLNLKLCKGCHITQHNDIQHNDTQHNNTTIMLNAIVLSVAFYLLLCGMSLCWVLLCWMSWRHTKCAVPFEKNTDEMYDQTIWYKGVNCP